MDDMAKNEAFSALEKLGTGDVWETTMFGMVRNSPTYGDQSVTVYVHERPAGISGNTWHVVAVSDTGSKASGNSDNSLRTALAILHWEDLDK